MIQPTVVTDPRVNSVVAERYRILQRIAAGGMGAVYVAQHIELGRTVAIKFLHPWIANEPDFKRRFEMEARAMSRLSHPCCAGVIDFGEHQGSPFLVMEYAEGDTLRLLLQEGAMPARRAVAIVRQVLAGLAHAHERGVVHRDIKPENVVVEQATGLGDRVRILDFGIARLADAASGTVVGAVVGTPGYMAPEQIRGEPIDARADLFATGVVLFELLTGERPDTTPPGPPSRSSKAGPISSELERVVARALHARKEERFQSAAEFTAALSTTPEAGAASAAPATVREPARHRERPALARWRTLGARARDGLARLRPAFSPSLRPSLRTLRRGGIAIAALSLIVAGIAVVRAATPHSPGAEEQRSSASEQSGPDLQRARRLAAAGRRDSALAELARLRAAHPRNAEVRYLEGQVNFDNFRWMDGLASYRATIEAAPAYRTDEALISNVIRCLDSDRYQRACAEFLAREIGPAALPQLDRAASSHELSNVRRRAAGVAAWIRRDGADE